MAVRRQQPAEIDAEYGTEDPWGYFRNPHDEARKQILVSTLEEYAPTRVLDIGCGNGFITQSIPARSIVGLDISPKAIEEAVRRDPGRRIDYRACSLFDVPSMELGQFDCVLITGVLYAHYIGKSLPLVYRIIDECLSDAGLLVSVHIDEWYFARFPYSRVRAQRYAYRTYTHLLEVYRK